MDPEVAKASERLREAGYKVGLYQREDGGTIYLRATLPHKPGSSGPKRVQEKINTRQRPNPIGIREAVKLAKRLDLELQTGEFDWRNWGYKDPEPDVPSVPKVGLLVEKWERQWFIEHGHTPSTRNTWYRNYGSLYARIPDDTNLTEAWILDWISTNSKPNTRSRKGWCQAMRKLVQFAELPIDVEKINRIQGSYGSSGTIKPRTLLTDPEIEEIWGTLPDLKSRWCWGMMAVFGCRNFELWFLDISDLLGGGSTIQVLQSKQKTPRTAYALPRAWIDTFGLRIPSPLAKPESTATHGSLGSKVTQFFTNRHYPSPYVLRHCWRQRAIRRGVDPSVAARSLGHSVAISQQHYTRWIAEELCRESFEKADGIR